MATKKATAKRATVRRTPAERLVIVREQSAKRLARAEQSVARSTEALAKAKARLERCQARLSQVKAEAPHRVAIAEMSVKLAEHREALKALKPAKQEPKAKAAKQVTEKAAAPAGTVTTETGETRPVSKEAVALVKKHIGKKQKGLFTPLDGEPATLILDALDAGRNVGDTFTLSIKGRKSAIKFTLDGEYDNGALRFEVV